MRFVWHLRWIAPAALVGFVAWEGLFASSTLSAVTTFQERTPYFDVLLPAGRVARTTTGVAINQEPVYVDVRLPVRAKTVELTLAITVTPVRTLFARPAVWPDWPYPIKLGAQTRADFVVDFASEPPQEIKPYTEYLYRYRLTDFSYVRPGHKVRFVISAPGRFPGEVKVSGGWVRIERESFSWDWFSWRLRNIL